MAFISFGTLLHILVILGGIYQFITAIDILCQKPLLSWTSLCSSMKPNNTVWAVLPHFLESQIRGLEFIANDTVGDPRSMVDLTEARVISVELANSVRTSELAYSFELANKIDRFADHALAVHRDLQQLGAKRDMAYDHIMTSLTYFYRLLRDASRTLPGADRLCQGRNAVLGRTEECPTLSLPDISEAFEYALQTYEIALRDLIIACSSSLSKVITLDTDLISMDGIISSEKHGVRVGKDELLGRLWTAVGGNKRQLATFVNSEHVLKHVGLYTEGSLRYLRMVQAVLEGMQIDVEELRAVALRSPSSGFISREMLLEVLARGVDRLGALRMRPSPDGPYLKEARYDFQGIN
ncbi:hypothetical protein BKA93DRAFT_752321 [Sparassis latifolia]